MAPPTPKHTCYDHKRIALLRPQTLPHLFYNCITPAGYVFPEVKPYFMEQYAAGNLVCGPGTGVTRPGTFAPSDGNNHETRHLLQRYLQRHRLTGRSGNKPTTAGRLNTKP